MPTTTKPRIPARHLRSLEKALSLAQLEHTSFGFATEKVTVHAAMGNDEETMTVDDFISTRTYGWRHSGLIPAIQNVLDWANGKEGER